MTVENRSSEIKRQMDARKQQAKTRDLLRVLDNLDTHHTLERCRDRLADTLLTHGPLTITQQGVPCCVVWARQRGYYGYKTLWLVGIWAIPETPHPWVVVGTSALTFSAALYNPESYHKIIRKDFRSYYQTASPLPDNELFRAAYQPEARLDLRQAIRSTVREWTPS